MTLQHGGLIAKEPFAATHLGEPLPLVSWLGQVVYAETRRLAGWTGLRVFDAIIWLGGFWAIAAACRRRGAATLAAAFALAVGVAPALSLASVRPQSFAVLGFGLLLALLRLELSPALTLAMALPLFVLWQNLHPSTSMAALILSATASVAWLPYFFGRRSARPWLLTALAGLAAAAVFATPDGISIIEISAANARSSIDNGTSEWLPAWAPTNWRFAIPFAAVALAVGWLLVRNRRRIDWVELTPVVVLFVMTLVAFRFVVFWGVALVPVVARVSSDPRPVRRRSWFEWVAAPAMLASAIGLALLARPTHFVETLPLEGIARLKAAGVRGAVFDFYPWGGPLIDAGSPAWVVAYDGRYYRYTPEEWRRYYRAMAGEVGLEALDRIYHPAAYLLAPGSDDKLISELRAAPATWREIWADRTCVVFIHKTAQPGRPQGARS